MLLTPERALMDQSIVHLVHYWSDNPNKNNRRAGVKIAKNNIYKAKSGGIHGDLRRPIVGSWESQKMSVNTILEE